MEIQTIMLPLQMEDKNNSTLLWNRISAKSCTCIIPFDLTITLPTVIIPHFTGMTALIREVTAHGVRYGDRAGCPQSLRLIAICQAQLRSLDSTVLHVDTTVVQIILCFSEQNSVDGPKRCFSP